MKRDVWDLDWVFEQSLLTLPVNGKPTDLVVSGGKAAIFDAMDRATGKYVFSRDLGLQNIVTAIDPETGEKTTNPALEPEPGKTKLLCPNANGGRNWPTTAFDPASYILYVPLVETCDDYSWTPRSAAQIASGGDDIHFAQRPRPDGDGKFGRLEAINLATGRVVWTHRQRAPLVSSVLATGGGLVFVGALDRFFSAYDAATGKLLWRTQLNAAPNSSPVTYRQPPGRHDAVGVQVAVPLIRFPRSANREWRTRSLCGSSAFRQAELGDRQFVQPTNCCVSTTACLSPSRA